jgi:hypothetical protein
LINFSSKIIILKYSFYKDYNLYPEVVNLVQLKTIFTTLTELLPTSSPSEDFNSLRKSINIQTARTISNNDVTNTVKSEKLNFSLFVDSLALASLHHKIHNDHTDITKIYLLLERMSTSEGVKKSLLRNQTLYLYLNY